MGSLLAASRHLFQCSHSSKKNHLCGAKAKLRFSHPYLLSQPIIGEFTPWVKGDLVHAALQFGAQGSCIETGELPKYSLGDFGTVVSPSFSAGCFDPVSSSDLRSLSPDLCRLNTSRQGGLDIACIKKGVM